MPTPWIWDQVLLDQRLLLCSHLPSRIETESVDYTIAAVDYQR
jgi:hypothetical protein